MTLLDVRGLSLRIHGTPILHDVSLRVAPGETLALTGESGSGKSMTALAVMGLTPTGTETNGRVRVDSHDVRSSSEAALCALRGRVMAMVFQEPMTALNPLATIGDQVAEGLRLHEGLDRRDAAERAGGLLRRVGLDMSPGRYPHELSGGQRQRVVIAMAIACRPRLLIADEPTTALDVTTQAEILALLRGLVAEYGMGLVLITHDLAVVAEMADRIVVMRKGRVVEEGPTASLLAAPAHPYTQGLLAAARPRPPVAGPPAGGPLLRVAAVSRDHRRRAGLFGRRGTLRALDGVTFAIAEGERVGLVGESGCGKSTLARAILGLDAPTEGVITLGGLPVFDPVARGRMQAVFQDPYGSFDPRHRVGRIVTEPFHCHPRAPRGAARDRVVAQALTDVGLAPEDAAKYPHEFSGGQRQRIAIARALVTGPDLIVFDEAVSALDVSVRAQILDLLAALGRRRAFAYLFISHDLGVVRAVTDRMLVMQAGRIVEEGATEAVFAAPSHHYTRALIAAAPTLPEPVP
ncbi:MAG: ABC transporter ATP-binding protein [Shimia sp.]